MKKMIAAIALTLGLVFGSAGVSNAAPVNAPYVVGMSQSQAQQVLKNAGVPYSISTIQGSGPRGNCLVISQNTRGDQRVRVGSTRNSEGRIVGVYETRDRGVGLGVRC